MAHNIKPGVATGDQVQEIFNYAKEKGFALPAVNVTGSSTINAVIETAAKLNAPVIVQFSNGGAQFNAGKGLSNAGEKSAIAGGIAGALHIHTLARISLQMKMNEGKGSIKLGDLKNAFALLNNKKTAPAQKKPA